MDKSQPQSKAEKTKWTWVLGGRTDSCCNHADEDLIRFDVSTHSYVFELPLGVTIFGLISHNCACCPL
jgi:hypothetical protein